MVEYFALGPATRLLSHPKVVRATRQVLATLTELVQGPNQAAQLYLVRCTRAVGAAHSLLMMLNGGDVDASTPSVWAAGGGTPQGIAAAAAAGVVSRTAASLADTHIPAPNQQASSLHAAEAADLHACVLNLLISVVQGARAPGLVRRLISRVDLRTLRDGFKGQFDAGSRYVPAP